MRLLKRATALTDYVHAIQTDGQTIGFVPTMGALHNGHLALIEASKKATDITVCSIFVNPTQFNNPTDFKHYPNTIEKDLELLLQAHCDVLFLPEAAEMYPADFVTRHYDLGVIETVLEGAFRPGHFQGVCQAVDRLLQLVKPHQVFFGQKDYQQCMVIKKLLALTHREQIHLTVIPTQREPNGLAMSSRNLRLSAAQREQASALFKTLTFLKAHIGEGSHVDLKNKGMGILKSSGFAVDYLEIADAENLMPVDAVTDKKLVALVAASIGGVRLIDNLPLN